MRMVGKQKTFGGCKSSLHTYAHTLLLANSNKLSQRKQNVYTKGNTIEKLAPVA